MWTVGSLLAAACGLLLLSLGQVRAAQSFRESPSDTSVIQGQTAILNCRVNGMKGRLLWTKAGVSLGYGRVLEGFPRYAVIGTESLGENDLMITDVQLSDDSVYQCQILPADGEPGIRASATLTVLIPPDAPEISGTTNGAVVKVPHQQETLELECVSRHGKPAPQIHWYRNDEELTADEHTIVYTTDTLADKRENAHSVLTIAPDKEDNEATYKCEAAHQALQTPLVTMVQLSVMHPPSVPEITGYTTGQVVQMNHTLDLECIARGGNPLAQVYWYRNGAGLDFSYDFGGNKAKNRLTFLVEATDNEAVYRCEASNLVTPQPLVAEVKLTVQFPPKKVTITGQEHAKAGETITLKCETTISNPPALISWLSGVNVLPEKTGSTVPSPKGGFITTSEIEVTLNSTSKEHVYQCTASNEAFGQVATESISLKVIYPPGMPRITGYTEGRKVTAGQIQMLTCQSMGGNPPATLTWWKGDTQLTAVTTRQFNLVTSQLSFILEPDDNGAEYICNATNAATVTPLLDKVTLKVNFPPKSLSIKTRPRQGRVGQKLTLTCTSATSNPASTVYWVKDGDRLPESIDGGQVAAAHGGRSSISILELMPTVADHGEIYACNAENDLIERAVSDAVTLNILFSPVFTAEVLTQFDIVEFQAGVINLTASANPSEVTYTWYRDNHRVVPGARRRRDISIPHFEQDGAVLDIKNITREDMGTYIVEATNSQGKGNHSILINVQYPAEIQSVSQNVLADKSTDARLECVVDANPLTADHVTWSRADYNMSRTLEEFDGAGRRSVLVIPGVGKEDSGLFVCTANNSIGDAEPSTRPAQLIVKYAPEIDKSPTYSKAAAEEGALATLTCKAEGAPQVSFRWSRIMQESDVSLDMTQKYSVKSGKSGLVQYESVLSVHNTSKSNYGQYKCVATNELGSDSHLISLDGTSKPDAPFDLHVVNSTHNAITLSWKAGFDGGSTQRFQVRYVEVGQSEGHKYADVVPPSATVFTVTGLKLATEYELDVNAINRKGESGYQDSPIRAKTSALSASSQQVDEVPLIIILVVSIIGMLLLGLNVLLILFFIRRRKKKLERDSSSVANTVEMYAAPTLTDDSRSVATYDRRSVEDYQDEYYKPYDDDEELRRFLGPAAYPDMPQYKPGPYYPGAGPLRNEYSPPPGTGQLGPMLYGSSPAVYPLGSLPRIAHMPEEEDDYTNQLRKMQQTLGPQPSESLSQLPHDIYGSRSGPPPPPARSTSRGTLEPPGPPLGPPVPSRNYDNEEVSRYGSQPTYETVSSGYQPPQHAPPSDVRGHLV